MQAEKNKNNCAQNKNIICLMGPTASGKTDLAIELCKKFSGEIISVDSALIYRSMDIGTAKPTQNILNTTPHYLVDICDPAENYSVAQFCNDAIKYSEKILQDKKLPILAGGTMMYFHCLQQGLSELPGADANIRKQIEDKANLHGWQTLHNELAQIDPTAAERIHPNDPQRLQRALEVYYITGQSMTELLSHQQGFLNDYNIINIAVAPQQREQLHERIAKRFDLMLANGFLDEVKALYQRGDLTINMPSMRCVGYRQAWLHLEGQLTTAEMRERAIIATRQLAKRQLTWLRSWRDLTWFDSNAPDLLEQMGEFISKQII